MSRQKKNGLILEEKRGMIHLVLTLTIRRKVLCALLILLVLVLIALGSSLGDDTRKLILDFLLGALQMTVFQRNVP